MMNPKTKTKTKTRTPKLTKNKSNGSNSSRFLLCCRPQELDHINMSDAFLVKQGVVLPRVLPAAAMAAAASLCGDDDENIIVKGKNDLQIMKKKKNKGNHQRLLGILKAVFFETSVARKIRKRKTKQKMSKTNGNENSMHKELSEVDKNGTVVSNNTSSSSSSLITSSSACSSSSSSDTNKSLRLLSTIIERRPKGNVIQVQKQHGNKGCYGPNVGLCFILVSLLILIIWGKVCAIFCTSTWLFFRGRWKIGNPSSENVAVNSQSLDSKEYKKKIIMEGLLQRDHSRRL